MPGLDRYNRLQIYKRKTVDVGTAARGVHLKQYSPQQKTHPTQRLLQLQEIRLQKH